MDENVGKYFNLKSHSTEEKRTSVTLNGALDLKDTLMLCQMSWDITINPALSLFFDKN